MLQFLHTKFTLLAEAEEEKAKEKDEERRQRQFFQEQFKLENDKLITCTALLNMKKKIHDIKTNKTFSNCTFMTVFLSCFLFQIICVH